MGPSARTARMRIHLRALPDSGPACGREADRVAEAERNFPHERRAGVVRWSGAC